MLGSALCARFAEDGDSVIAADLSKSRPAGAADARVLDVTDEAAVRDILHDAVPDVVLHCAATVDVDAAEADFTGARAVNALGTRNVARHTPAGTKLVYISTDSVFDGRRGDYAELDLPAPVNNYAKTKLEGEWFALQEHADTLVVRTNFIGRASAGKGSFAGWIVDSLTEGRSVRLATDWIASTAHVSHVAGTIAELVAAGAEGVYHGSGSKACSKHDLGVAIADGFGLDASLIEPILFAELELTAPRPRNASLDCRKAEALLGHLLPDYLDGVRALRAEWRA